MNTVALMSYPIVDRVLPLSKAQEAHEIIEKGEQFGKIILKP
jgi:NADPH:quinone reductase-like Zn-dependent oxidoreductase